MGKEMTKVEVERKALATARIEKSRVLLIATRMKMLEFAELARDVRENKDFEQMGYDSWGAFCSDPEVYDLKQKSVDEYISIYEHLILEKKQKKEKLSGLGPNKLRMINKIMDAGHDPDPWIKSAYVQGERDFCDTAKEELFDIPAPDHVGKAVAKNHPCPLWDACTGKCHAKVDVKAESKKMAEQMKKDLTEKNKANRELL